MRVKRVPMRFLAFNNNMNMKTHGYSNYATYYAVNLITSNNDMQTFFEKKASLIWARTTSTGKISKYSLSAHEMGVWLKEQFIITLSGAECEGDQMFLDEIILIALSEINFIELGKLFINGQIPVKNDTK